MARISLIVSFLPLYPFHVSNPFAELSKFLLGQLPSFFSWVLARTFFSFRFVLVWFSFVFLLFFFLFSFNFFFSFCGFLRMQDDGRERRGLLQQLTPFMTDTSPVIQNIREKETQREEKEEERKERRREKREEFKKKKEDEMEETDMQESLDEDLSDREFPEGKMKEGKEEVEGVGALSASGTYCAFLSQEELQVILFIP